MTSPDPKTDAFHVSLDQHLLEAAVHRWPGIGKWFGNLESNYLREQLDALTIDRPVYVAGLARSGSTILLEFLAAHPHVATHRYCDFPLIFTPYWSRELQRRTPASKAAPVERAHGDGIAITPESPEAMEEPLWMAYFQDAHNPARSQVLSAEEHNAAFDNFYRDHLRKLMLIRGGHRYVSKGNYNVTRLGYLRRLFPDLRVVVPVRHPLHHIASLMKQHRLFVEGETRYPRALSHMRRVGHFEFGLDRRPINAGNTEVIAQIQQLWDAGEEVRGWARYWSHIYGWLLDALERDTSLREAALLVRFEDLCDEPHGSLTALLDHTQLDNEGLADAFAPTIHAPTYYRPNFTDAELDALYEETQAVAQRFGYTEAESSSAARTRPNHTGVQQTV